jgi:hypothetical protein
LREISESAAQELIGAGRHGEPFELADMEPACIRYIITGDWLS